MIDLIIPYYNNRVGLLNTLKSIDQSIFKVTIIDDHSTEPPLFPLDAAQCFRVNINSGPGFARQLGIEKTSNEYIMFLDTGDVFISLEAQTEILDLITKHTAFIVFIYLQYTLISLDIFVFGGFANINNLAKEFIVCLHINDKKNSD